MKAGVKAAAKWIRSAVTMPLLVLALGFAFGLAANVIWSWQGGPIRVLGGALASLALPGALHLWPRVPTAGVWRVRIRGKVREVPIMRIVRATVMTLIAVVAAATTFVHAASLLIEHGENYWLACAYPVITELAVVMGALAHRADHAATAAAQPAPQSARPQRAPRPRPPAPPARTPGPATVATTQRPGRRALARELGITEHEARKLIESEQTGRAA